MTKEDFLNSKLYADAEWGDAEAQLKVGDCYYNGEGVEKDLKEALEWYKMAVDRGCEDANRALEKPDFADLQYSEADLEYDIARKCEICDGDICEFGHLEKAANLNHPIAAFELGLKCFKCFYEEETPSEEKILEGCDWFYIAERYLDKNWVPEEKYYNIDGDGEERYIMLLLLRDVMRLLEDEDAETKYRILKKVYDITLDISDEYSNLELRDEEPQTVEVTNLQGEKKTIMIEPPAYNAFSWAGAYAYTIYLNVNKYGGFSDWRLPNDEDELRILKEQNVFPNRHQEEYWTTIASFDDIDGEISITFEKSNDWFSPYDDEGGAFVCCLRGDILDR